MPYKIMKSGDEWCVVKEGGESIGCHDSEAAAKKQMAAVYASESKAVEIPDDPDELREVRLQAYRDFSALMDQLETTNLIPHEDEDKAADDLPEPEPEPQLDPDPVIYVAPDSNDRNILKALKDRFTGGLKPGQQVIKAASGPRHMVIVTSNSYRDREGETLTTAALQKDVDRRWTEDGEYMIHDPLLFWHDDDMPVGEIVWGDMVGPFYVEVARETDHILSKTYFDYREAHPDEKWGASHRFAYLKSRRSTDGLFHDVHKRETTTLPLEAAANLLTISEVIPMSDKRAKKFDEMAGFDGAFELFKTEGIEALTRKLAENGVEHKAVDGDDATPANPDLDIATQIAIKAIAPFAGSYMELMDDVTALSDEVEQIKTARTEAEKAEGEQQTALTEALAELKAVSEQFKEHLAAQPTRASQSTTTEVNDNQLTPDEKKSMTEPDTFWGGAFAKQEGA